MKLSELKKLLKKAWSKEASADSENWTLENPTWGQCAITALVVQDFLGGELIRGYANKMISHYWNCLPNGQEIDFTKEQFPKGTIICKDGDPDKTIRDRTYVLSYPDTRKRYTLLRLAVENLIQANPLFSDLFYRLCFEKALESECQNMKFGCVAARPTKEDGSQEILLMTCNKVIEPLRDMCEPKCIRFKIQSRTESMLGACGHAEEWALWELLNPEECELYIAGFDAKTSNPYIKKEREFTCLRCAIQMYLAKLQKVYVPVIDHWEALTPEEALRTAKAFALREKQI